jgi:hypothetical protein
MHDNLFKKDGRRAQISSVRHKLIFEIHLWSNKIHLGLHSISSLKEEFGEYQPSCFLYRLKMSLIFMLDKFYQNRFLFLIEKNNIPTCNLSERLNFKTFKIL